MFPCVPEAEKKSKHLLKPLFQPIRGGTITHQLQVIAMIPCVVRTLIMSVVMGLVLGNHALVSADVQEFHGAEKPQILWKVQSAQNIIVSIGL